MFHMPTIDNLVVLAAVLEVPMDAIIVIDINVSSKNRLIQVRILV